MYFVPIKFVFVIVAITAQAINDNPDYDSNQESQEDTEITGDPLPHLAKLGYSSPYGWIWICSGALVHPQKVVTNQICITRKIRKSELKIVKVQNKNFKIARSEILNEIAVLLLEEPADFVQRPACLSPKLDTNTAFVAGWGGLLFENQIHGTINGKAETIMGAIFEIVGDELHVRPTTELAPCVADRGGPLQIPSNRVGCSYDIIGVLRDWKDCGEKNSFGSYIALPRYNDWIRRLLI